MWEYSSQPAATLCLMNLPPWLPLSTPPTGLDESFFNSVVVGLSYSLISWYLWVFKKFLNCLLSFFQLCEDTNCIYLCFHLNQKLTNGVFQNYLKHWYYLRNLKNFSKCPQMHISYSKSLTVGPAHLSLRNPPHVIPKYGCIRIV